MLHKVQSNEATTRKPQSPYHTQELPSTHLMFNTTSRLYL